ncbi:MAG TPA: LysM peptidoglycan-binding domain-containing protein [Lysobacter sp.]
MNRAIGHLNLVVVAAVLSACTTTSSVRVYPAVHGASATPATTWGDAPGRIVVQPGDTLYGIAARQHVPMADLAKWNGLVPPYTLHAGDHLRLVPPRVGEEPVAPARSAAPARTTKPAPRAASPASPRRGASVRFPRSSTR